LEHVRPSTIKINISTEADIWFKVARSIHRGMKRSKLVTLPNSSHVPFWEEREKFMGVVRRFLDQVNGRA